MQNGFWRTGSWKKIPIFFHWSIFLWLPWYWWHNRSIVDSLLTFAAFVVLLGAHELGHAIAARSRRTRVIAIKLYLLHGICEHEMPYYGRDDVFIAWGGVLAQLVLLVLALAIKYLLLGLPEVAFFLDPALSVFIGTNIFMMVFNLLPIALLDGHKAWGVLRPLWESFRHRGKTLLRATRNLLDFRKRRAAAKESERVTYELLNRLKKK